jgi:mutator protein MutT
VLERPDGAFLLAQRPAGKVYAGWWEFPGGKIEPGEPRAQALARELHEELGIDIGEPYPWITRVSRYAHGTVRLQFFRVHEWQRRAAAARGPGHRWQRFDATDGRSRCCRQRAGAGVPRSAAGVRDHRRAARYGMRQCWRTRAQPAAGLGLRRSRVPTIARGALAHSFSCAIGSRTVRRQVLVNGADGRTASTSRGV